MYLTIENIRKAYDGKLAVDGLSLSVPKGAIYGIIGPNGAGKTTTIRMIMNIIAPDEGQVVFDGRKVDESFKDRVGYLPEERGLYKKMTIKEVVTYMAELKSCPAATAQERMDPWLERLDLFDYRDKKVEELSKGMAQKLQFITTIIHDPDIVILDELFSGLDPINIEIIKDVVLELKREGKTILFSTHVMEQAEKLCDYVCMISRGKKVIDGKLSDVKAQFGKNSLQVDMEGDGNFIRELPGVSGVTEFNNYLEVNLGEGAEPSAILKTVASRVKVRRFEVVEPSLYQIFIKLAKVDPADSQREEGGDHV
jgi:ABC-2 type transport system ATP-binding protein